MVGFLASRYSEMGQGVLTATATLVAEELEVSIEQIAVVQAHKPGFGMQMTGGSMSTAGCFCLFGKLVPRQERSSCCCFRQMGRTCRRVPCQDGQIHHTVTEQKLTYGELTLLLFHSQYPKTPIEI